MTTRITNYSSASEAEDNGRIGGGENIARDPDGRVVVDVDDIITTETKQGTEKSTENRPYGIKSIKKMNQ